MGQLFLTCISDLVLVESTLMTFFGVQDPVFWTALYMFQTQLRTSSGVQSKIKLIYRTITWQGVVSRFM